MYSQLAEIIIKNWPHFANEFGDLDRFTLKVGGVITARNGLKHNRELNRSEKASAEASIIWLEDCLSKYLSNSEESLS